MESRSAWIYISSKVTFYFIFLPPDRILPDHMRTKDWQNCGSSIFPN
jgi:hypothetical protein